MANTMDKFRALSASLKADAAALRRDRVYMCCVGTYEYAAAHIDAIVRESEVSVPVAATLDDAAADPALTLDVARELLRDAAAGIRQLAARATPRTEPAEGRGAVGADDSITLTDVASVLGEIAEGFDGGEYAITDETRRVLIDFAHGIPEHPLFNAVGHYFAQNPVPGTTPPAVASVRVTDAERHDMERKARELLAVEYERRGSRRMAEGIRSTPAAEFGDRDLGCAVRAIVAALAAREGDGARVTDTDPGETS